VTGDLPDTWPLYVALRNEAVRREKAGGRFGLMASTSLTYDDLPASVVDELLAIDDLVTDAERARWQSS
jgi:hypothetical protein